MLWLLYAALTAFFESLKDVFSKKSLKDVDPYIAAFALRLFAIPFILPFLIYTGIPEISSGFWTALAVSGAINLVATILYMTAIQASDLSLTVPMVAFTPLFLLITSPLIVGEFPSIYGLVGVLLIVVGSYTLNIRERHNGYLAPFKALVKHKGPKIMLLVAFLWSITANFDKVGVLNSSPAFWIAAFNSMIALLMIPILIYKKDGKQVKKLKELVPIGMFSAFSLVFQMTALTLTIVPYVISIKRTSTMLCVVWGWLIFKEKGIKERLLGTLIMVLGVVLISLA